MLILQQISSISLRFRDSQITFYEFQSQRASSAAVNDANEHFRNTTLRTMIVSLSSLMSRNPFPSLRKFYNDAVSGILITETHQLFTPLHFDFLSNSFLLFSRKANDEHGDGGGEGKAEKIDELPNDDLNEMCLTFSVYVHFKLWIDALLGDDTFKFNRKLKNFDVIRGFPPIGKSFSLSYKIIFVKEKNFLRDG